MSKPHKQHGNTTYGIRKQVTGLDVKGNKNAGSGYYPYSHLCSTAFSHTIFAFVFVKKKKQDTDSGFVSHP